MSIGFDALTQTSVVTATNVQLAKTANNCAQAQRHLCLHWKDICW